MKFTFEVFFACITIMGVIKKIIKIWVAICLRRWKGNVILERFLSQIFSYVGYVTQYNRCELIVCHGSEIFTFQFLFQWIKEKERKIRRNKFLNV